MRTSWLFDIVCTTWTSSGEESHILFIRRHCRFCGESASSYADIVRTPRGHTVALGPRALPEDKKNRNIESLGRIARYENGKIA